MCSTLRFLKYVGLLKLILDLFNITQWTHKVEKTFPRIKIFFKDCFIVKYRYYLLFYVTRKKDFHFISRFPWDSPNSPSCSRCAWSGTSFVQMLSIICQEELFIIGDTTNCAVVLGDPRSVKFPVVC